MQVNNRLNHLVFPPDSAPSPSSQIDLFGPDKGKSAAVGAAAAQARKNAPVIKDVVLSPDANPAEPSVKLVLRGDAPPAPLTYGPGNAFAKPQARSHATPPGLAEFSLPETASARAVERTGLAHADALSATASQETTAPAADQAAQASMAAADPAAAPAKTEHPLGADKAPLHLKLNQSPAEQFVAQAVNILREFEQTQAQNPAQEGWRNGLIQQPLAGLRQAVSKLNVFA